MQVAQAVVQSSLALGPAKCTWQQRMYYSSHMLFLNVEIAS